MSPASFFSIAGVPELLMFIVEYLDPCDILHCMLSCKALARDLEPCIWRDISTRRGEPPQGPLLRNLHLIWTLYIDYRKGWEKYFKAFVKDPSAPSTTEGSSSEAPPPENQLVNLRMLTIVSLPTKDARKNVMFPFIVTIIERNHRHLHTLTLPALVLKRGAWYELITTANILNSAPNLREVAIGHGGEKCGVEQTKGFLKACLQLPQLASLRCNFLLEIGYWKDMFAFFTDPLISSQYKVASQLKQIHLPVTYTPFTIPALLPLLQHRGSILEIMTASAENIIGNTELVETIEYFCPKLRKLVIIWNSHMGPGNQAVIAMNCGAKTTDLVDIPLIPNPIKLLIQHFAEALREIDISFGPCSSEVQDLLLKSCPNLERMWVSPHKFRPQDDRSLAVHYSVRWACLKLKELSLTYYPWGKRFIPSRPLYEQLGQLVHLERLAIGRRDAIEIYERDLTLQKGAWLSKLVGLKKLRRFHFTTDLWSKMGAEEMEFIHDNWPLLEEITFSCTRKRFKEIKHASHWQWLCEKRPALRLARGYRP